MQEKTDFKPVLEDIKNGDFKNAESQLKTIIKAENKTQKAKDYAKYLLGYINTLWNNKNGKKNIAKHYLLENIESENPVENSYILFADLEEDKNIAINYLNEGLKKFTDNPFLLESKLKYIDDEDKSSLIGQIIEKKIINYKLINQELIQAIRLSEWDFVKDVASIAIKNFNESEEELMDYKFLYSLAIVMGKCINDIDVAIKYLLEIITNDRRNRYQYSTYVFLAMAYLISKKLDLFYKYIDKIPVNNSLCDLDDGPFYVIPISFEKIYNEIFKEFKVFLVNDKKRKTKIDALYSLYLFYPFEIYDIVRFSKKDIRNIEKYFQTYNSAIIGKCLFYMYKQYSMNIKAFSILLKIVEENKNIYDEIYNVEDIYKNATHEEIQLMINELVKVTDECCSDEVLFITCDFVKFLYNNKKYEEISKLCERLNVDDIVKHDFAFESAYSFSEIQNNAKAKTIYEKLLTIDSNNSSVINNLGVIYEQEENYYKALQLYENANRISPNEINIRNLERINNTIIKLSKEERNLKNRIIKNLGSNLNLTYFEKLGYDDNLKQKINTINNESLKNILQRDLESAVIALATKQFKSADILLGSIIEALLVYVLETNSIKSCEFDINGAVKKINLRDMNLAQLLEASLKNNLIDKKNYQLGAYIKDCRNVVHPEREIKDKYIFSEDNSLTSWNIVKSFIFKLL